jgi:hypothetical protein
MQMLLLCVITVSHFHLADTSFHLADTAPSKAARFIPSPPGTPLTLRITTDPLLKNFTNITVKWELLVNGSAQQKGTLPLHIPASRHPVLVHLPAHLPTGNEDAWLRLDYHGTTTTSPLIATASPLIATESLLLKPYSTDDFIPAAGDLSFTDSNDVFTIGSSKMLLRFDKETGLIQHFEADHRLLADTGTLTPALWDSVQPRLQLFSTSTGTQLVIVRSEYTLPEVSSLLHLSYSINAGGVMLVEQSLEPDTTRQGGAPPPPHFGMTWLLPPGFDSIVWYAPATDDITGAIPSIHSSSLPASNVPASNVRWCAITDHEGRGIRISADSNYLNISLLSTQVHISRPFPADEIPSGAIRFSYKITPILPAVRRDHH